MDDAQRRSHEKPNDPQAQLDLATRCAGARARPTRRSPRSSEYRTMQPEGRRRAPHPRRPLRAADRGCSGARDDRLERGGRGLRCRRRFAPEDSQPSLQEITRQPAHASPSARQAEARASAANSEVQSSAIRAAERLRRAHRARRRRPAPLPPARQRGRDRAELRDRRSTAYEEYLDQAAQQPERRADPAAHRAAQGHRRASTQDGTGDEGAGREPAPTANRAAKVRTRDSWRRGS